MAVSLYATAASAQGIRYDNVVQTSTTVSSGQTVTSPAAGVTITACSTAPIATVSEVGAVVTATTSVAHGLVAGQAIQIAGVANPSYSGTFTVATTPTSTSFTYIDAATGLASSSGGTVLPNNVPCTPLANVYADQSLTNTAANPTTSDALGNYGFWLAPGTYVFSLSGGAVSPSFYPVTAQPGAVDTVSNQTVGGNKAFTGNVTVSTIDNIKMVDGQTYACSPSGIAAALAALPATGGTVNARGCQGSLSWPNQLVLNKPVYLLLPQPGSAVFTVTGSPGTSAFMIASSNVTIDGGSFILSGAQVHGVRWTGPTTHTTVKNMIITGSGSLGDNQNGILGFSAGGANSNIKVLNNIVSGTTIGIIFNAFNVGESYSDIDIEGNTVFSIVGSAAGTGYGINVASGMGTGTSDHITTRISHNFLQDVGRHSIYTGFGRGYVVDGNVIKDHSKTNGGSSFAIECSRAQDTVISNNVFDNPYGGAIEVVTQPDFPPDSLVNKNTVVTHNVVRDPHVRTAYIIGTGAPLTEGFPTAILFTGNSCYSTVDPTIHCLDIYSGKNITVSDNVFDVVGATGLTNLVDIVGSQETAGTANYTDNVEFHGNTFIADNSSAALVRVEALAAASASILTFNQNSFQGSFSANGFFFLASLTDTNFTIPTPSGVATITSGFGTSPSFAFNKVPKEIQVTIGTGGTATTGVLGMPTALTGWDCKATDLNTSIVTRETAYTTTSVTFTAASAWTAGDKLLISCGAF